MTGRLRGTLFGRPVELDAAGRQMSLRIASLRSAWRLRRSVATSMMPLLSFLRTRGMSLTVVIGSRLSVEIFPRPSVPLRMLLPALNRISAGDKID